MCYRYTKYDFDNPCRVKDKLFKFYPVKDYHIAAFQQGILFFAHPSKLNDLFDTSSRLIDPYDHFRQLIGWDSDKAKMLDSHGICSFVEAPDVKNERMWIFYADCFNGFAIEFDPEKLNNPKYAPIQLRAVKYLGSPLDLNNRSVIYHIADEDFCLDDILVDQNKYSDRIFQCLHLVKNKQMWHEENEWRMIVGNIRGKAKPHSGGGGYLLAIDQSCFKALYIGFKVDETIQSQLRDIAASYGMKAYKITPEIIGNKWDMSINPF